MEPGLEHSEEFTVEGELLTTVRGSLPRPVLSTPRMISLMEYASVNAHQGPPRAGHGHGRLRGLHQARRGRARGLALHGALGAARVRATSASCASRSRSPRATASSALGRHERRIIQRGLMELEPFRIERFYARYEFTTRYMLSSSDCESRTIAELLELEPDAHERLLRDWCGYTESEGAPELREAIAAHLRPHRAGRRDRHVLRRGGHLPALPRAAAPRRPRDRRDPVLRVGARGRAQHRRRDRAVAPPLRGRLGARPRRARSVHPPRHAPRLHQPAAQPDRHADGPRDPRARRRARRAALRRRGLPRARARPRRPPPGGLRPRRARRLARQHLQELRPARPAHRLAGHARRRPA